MSCRTERSVFESTISSADGVYLDEHDTLTKRFSGRLRTELHWTGDLLISKHKNSLEIKQVGEWRLTSEDGKDLHTILNFDRQGFLERERLFWSLNGEAKQMSETTCKRDSIDGKVQIVCNNTYRSIIDGQVSKGRLLIIGKKSFRDGKWEFYNSSGELEKTIDYVRGKEVKK